MFAEIIVADIEGIFADESCPACESVSFDQSSIPNEEVSAHART